MEYWAAIAKSAHDAAMTLKGGISTNLGKATYGEDEFNFREYAANRRKEAQAGGDKILVD